MMILILGKHPLFFARFLWKLNINVFLLQIPKRPRSIIDDKEHINKKKTKQKKNKKNSDTCFYLSWPWTWS